MNCLQKKKLLQISRLSYRKYVTLKSCHDNLSGSVYVDELSRSNCESDDYQYNIFIFLRSKIKKMCASV